MHPDLKLLQGTWNVQTLEVDGQSMPAGGSIVVKGERFTSTGMGAVYEGRLELDATASPRRIDLKFDAGPEKGNINPGIYELAADSWKLCLATRGSVRPAIFATTAGSGFALETLARASGRRKPKTPIGSGPATEFEGEWQMVSGVMNGVAMEESAVQWVKRVTRGNLTTVYAGSQVMMQMEFITDSSASPKAIDYRNTAGANKGKSQRGIYAFEAGLLKVCVAAPDDPRPAEFRSTRGDGRTLTEWKPAAKK